MKPIEILQIIRYWEKHPGTPKEIPFSIDVNRLFERILLETSQKARFITAIEEGASPSSQQLGDALDQYALSEDEKILFSNLLHDVVWELAGVIKAYLSNHKQPVEIDDNVIKFNTDQPLALWSRSTVSLIGENIYLAALYYILREWYIKANIQEAEVWDVKYMQEIGKLKSNMNHRVVHLSIQPHSLG